MNIYIKVTKIIMPNPKNAFPKVLLFNWILVCDTVILGSGFSVHL